MEFEDFEAFRRNSPAWRLLRADNASLILSFLRKIFVVDNVRAISSTELVNRLDDELYALNERLGEVRFPRSAQSYLADWAAPEAGWLRKYYPAGSDEPHFDLTPAVEKAIGWVESLQARAFVGTESRLNTVFELLRQMVFGAETDPEVRLAELDRRRQEIDAEIAQVRRGDIALLDTSAQRDRYQQFAATARELLADFREVEANFRALDRELRARIAAWDGSKGALLDDVLGSRATIANSDQGRSFQAFYDFLLSDNKQTELSDLLDRVQSLDVIEADPRMRHIHHDWMDAAERTQATVRLLSEQLRRFLDDQVWLENRRVMDLIHNIEATALAIRDHHRPDLSCEIDATSPDVVLPMERPLYTPVGKVPLHSGNVAMAAEDVDASLLFEQIHVDPQRLSATVRAALQGRSQVGLGELLDQQPLQQGLAELVTYFALDDPSFEVMFDEQVRESVQWSEADGPVRVAAIPRVTFIRALANRDET